MRRIPTVPLDTALRVYTRWMDTLFELGQEMVEDLEKGTYTPGRLFSDWMAVWATATLGWADALRTSVSAPVPTVLITLEPGDNAADQSVPLAGQHRGKIEATPLVALGERGGAPQAEARANTADQPTLAAEWATDGSPAILINVQPAASRPGSARQRQPDEAPRVYLSLLHMNGTLGAVVYVVDKQ